MPEASNEQFEKLGAFYLGKEIASADGDPTGPPVLYDAKDLTTHGVIVGMTGSGKTGLAVGLLEEAAIDGIPSIVIDVKGDLTNLLLAFPELRPEDFQPWVDPGAASRKGMTQEAFAASTAEMWKNGLAGWGQDGDRIRRYRDAVDRQLYTPGSTRGVPISLLASMAPPSAESDIDSQNDHVAGTVSSLLTLLGLDADPIQSREHIFLSNLLLHAFEEGRSLTLADLIRLIQKPPFDTVGVIDLESFYPAKDRTSLAMTVNNLLASPGFSSWREGEPLSIPNLLQAPDGRPRMSILYLAHLSDTERMFFVTRLLNEIVSWMRTQAGTGSLRALVYMDEVFGYFPPSANPPSKKPLLTLMKQARAYGVGVVLATQNPVDLDYKGLSNAGTWMLGRLQTERDKLRVLDGLEGASGGAFDRAAADATLSGLGKRRFLLHSVHEREPKLFHTRWVMSYLAGPLTMTQVVSLSAKPEADAPPKRPPAKTGRHAAATTAPAATAAVIAAVIADTKLAGGARAASAADDGRPILPAAITEAFEAARGSNTTYKPGLYGEVRVHYVNATWKVDSWVNLHVSTGVGAEDPWMDAVSSHVSPDHDREPWPKSRFGKLPSGVTQGRTFAGYKKSLAGWVYRTQPVTLLREKKLGLYSKIGEDEAAFRARIRHAVREHRDAAVEVLRDRYEVKVDRLDDRIQAAQARVEKEESQYDQAKLSSFLDIGATLLGGVLGRRRSSVSGTSRAVRGFGRASKEKQDIAHAQERLEDLESDLEALQNDLATEIDELAARFDADSIELESKELAPRKSDIEVTRLSLLWRAN